MKSFSIAVICLTLVLFYSLAVHQQGNIQHSECDSLVTVNDISKEQLQIDTETHLYFEDDFAMQVTGKEHRYLHTGISYLKPIKKKYKTQGITFNSDLQKPNVSGS